MSKYLKCLFVFLLGSCSSTQSFAEGGSISGVVRAAGKIPQLKLLQVNRDEATCGRHQPNETLTVGENGELKNAVVFIVGEDFGKPEPGSGVIDQKGCRYTPHVQILTRGSKLVVKNSDPILHNVHIFWDATRNETLPQGNVAQPVEGMSNQWEFRGKQFREPQFLVLACDVHPWMSAIVAVIPHRLYALSDEAGRFTIKDVPAGAHKLQVWHEVLEKSETSVIVENGKSATCNIELSAKQPKS